MKSKTSLKIQNGKYKIKTVDQITGESIVEVEAMYVSICSNDKWYAIEPKSEKAIVWFEQNGYPLIRKFFMEHFRNKNEFLDVLNRMIADFNL